MSKTIYSDTWGSVVYMVNELIDQFQLDYPGVTIQFHDWEAHANFSELPNADLIGPLTLSLNEESPDMIEASFAIGVSSYSDDKSLFRLRDYIGQCYERIRFGKKFVLYDATTTLPKGQFVFTSGTILAPMSNADVRPFQYVQGLALLTPGN